MKPILIFLLLAIVLFTGCKKGTDDDDVITPDPTVDFIFSTGDGFAPDTIQFTNQSKDADGYQWDFSDGISSTETSPSHVFQNPGTYNVAISGTCGSGADTITYISSVTYDSIAPSLSNNRCICGVTPCAEEKLQP